MKKSPKIPCADLGIKPKTNDVNERTLLQSLRENLNLAEDSLWTVGNCINQLKAQFHWTTKELAPYFKQQRNRLDEIAATARAYPEGMRHPNLNFYGHEVARSAAKRKVQGMARHTGKKMAPDYKESAEEVAKQGVKKSNHDRREATRSLLEKERKQHEPARRAAVAKLSAANSTLVETMHHIDCRELMKKIAKGTLAMIHLDVPYANYYHTKSGALTHTTTLDQECDNNNRDDTISVTIEALQLAVSLLRKDAPICLWQAANGLQYPISKVIDELGLMMHPTFIWDKGHSQMGDPSSGIMFSAEECYILTRKGERPLGSENIDRRQVFSATRVEQRADNFELVHLMQKPHEVNAELLRRFTAPGDLVLDAFGCSASMCIAAQIMRRPWIYSESNKHNFALGKRNMQNHLLNAEKSAA